MNKIPSCGARFRTAMPRGDSVGSTALCNFQCLCYLGSRIKSNNEIVLMQWLSAPDSLPTTLPTTPILHEDVPCPTTSEPELELGPQIPADETLSARIWPLPPMEDVFSDSPPCDIWSDQDTSYLMDPSDPNNSSPHGQNLFPSFAKPRSSALIQTPWPIPVFPSTVIQAETVS
jgi:hypothetical protein